jgi:hypothetical protein
MASHSVRSISIKTLLGQIREQENTKRQRKEERKNEQRQRIEEIGEWPAFDEDMAKLGASYGRMASEGKAYLAALSDDSDSE